MAKYRPVDVRMWNDRRFRALGDDGRLLWVFLLTTSFTQPIPGVIVAGENALAEEIGWSPKRFGEGFRELVAKGFLVKREGRLLWLQNGFKYQRIAGPNAVKGMSKVWDDIPDCSLKHELWLMLKIACKSWSILFSKGFPEPLHEPFANPIVEIPSNTSARGSTQEQEQEQEQDTEMRKAKTPSPTRLVTDAFNAYFASATNGSKPTWDSRSGAQIKQLLAGHGVDEVLRRVAVLASPAPPTFPPQPWDFKTFRSHFDRCATGDVGKSAPQLPLSVNLENYQ